MRLQPCPRLWTSEQIHKLANFAPLRAFFVAHCLVEKERERLAHVGGISGMAEVVIRDVPNETLDEKPGDWFGSSYPLVVHLDAKTLENADNALVTPPSHSVLRNAVVIVLLRPIDDAPTVVGPITPPLLYIHHPPSNADGRRTVQHQLRHDMSFF